MAFFARKNSFLELGMNQNNLVIIIIYMKYSDYGSFLNQNVRKIFRIVRSPMGLGYHLVLRKVPIRHEKLVNVISRNNTNLENFGTGREIYCFTLIGKVFQLQNLFFL